MRKIARVFSAMIMLILASTAANAQSINDAINTLSTFSYSTAAGRTIRTPAETLSAKNGNCVEDALFFTDAGMKLGFNTEIIGESYKLPDGSIHKAPNDGHFIGIVTDGKSVWANSSNVVKMFDTVDAAVASGGVGFGGLPAGTTVFNQVVLSGDYGEFMKQTNSGKINW